MQRIRWPGEQLCIQNCLTLGVQFEILKSQICIQKNELTWIGGEYGMNYQNQISKLLGSTATAVALAGGLAGGLVGGSSASAQGSDGDAFVLEEIVVTARKREESFQEVPAAMTVLSREVIERANIDTPMDLARIIPNVFMTQDTNFGDTQLFIRGALNVKDSESTFAFIVDGVQQANPNSFNRQFFDLEQIEIVKGPQNALYGRNAIGGAIIISTRKPSDEVRGFIDITAGNGRSIQAQVAVSGPIANNIYGSLAVSHFDTEGLLTNEFTNEKVDFLRNESLQARIIMEPTEDLSIDMRVQASDVSGGAINFAVQFPPFSDIETAPGEFLNTNDTSIPFRANVRAFNNQNREEASIKVDYDTSFATFTLIGQWDNLEENVGSDGAVNLGIFAPGFMSVNGLPIAGFSSTLDDGTQFQERDQRDYSAEFRIASPADSDAKLSWLVGAFILDAEREVLLNTGLDTGDGVIVRQAVAGINTVNPTATLLNSRDNNTAYAFFGQFQYDIFDDLELAFAARWEQEDRTNTNLVPDIIAPASILQGSPRALTAFPGEVRKNKFSEFTPRASLRYNVADNLSVFASYAHGFRSGGFNPSGSAVQVIAFDDPTTTLIDSFVEETADSYEVGFKSILFNGRMQLNGAAFYTNTDNAHFLKFFPVSIVRAVQIIEDTVQKGIELDWTFRVSNDLTFFGNAGYLDSEIKRNTETAGTEGNTVPFSPDFTLSLGANYDTQLTDKTRFFTRWDYTLTGKIEFDTANTPGTSRDTVGLVNASAGIIYDENWTLSVWSKNMLDKKFNGVGIPVGGNLNFVPRAQPATYGASIRYLF